MAIRAPGGANKYKRSCSCKPINIDLCRIDSQKIIFRAEDLVLAEERTTEADKELIMEGENIARLSDCHGAPLCS